uniref:PPE family protein n=1 Tax=Angiostrongylus cantonensis TaxID=6313 RepID=A0A0K0D780_ANGCA
MMDNAMCRLDMNMNIGAIPAMHLTISGTLSTTNIIMANWSTAMWQSVVNRAVRMLASGPFGTNFSTAVATVN